ncbi:vacuolar H+ ATPase E1 [Sanghuangporus baumii]|uniref:Vacuolar H+ ATPase E1 n=1 Tax=Sanghuangporus baumii TaxID=108892 RepID=A0A9Q5I3W4_SANBA|nr:vacuolar H+ ATPase E1 [Sanghuangporus baumii]
MSTRPLNDEEVVSEMNKMVAFIKQEAMEKAREIRVKADEEFAIEKACIDLIRYHQNIDAQYEKKRKQAEVAQKIAQSTQLNKSRLRLLQRREEHLEELFEEAREELLALSKDEGRYSQLIEGIVLQGLLQLVEPEVRVLTRPKDVKLAEKAGEGAKEQYVSITGRDISVSVVGDLSDTSAGGIKLQTSNSKISLDNTLDERLRLLEDRMLPEIRYDLFGPNDNRKFFN